MKRHELEHILRASAAITGADRFVVIGSQAIFGPVHEPPADLVESIEADVFTQRDIADAELIEGSIGEGSPFHNAFGYYAHGVGRETAVLPDGWEARLVAMQSANTGGAIGLCLDVHDLAVSKIVAGRDKDLKYVEGLFKHRLADPSSVRQRLAVTPLPDELRQLCEHRVDRLARLA